MEIVELVSKNSITVAAEKVKLDVTTFKKRYPREIRMGRLRRRHFKNVALDRIELLDIEHRECLGCEKEFLSEGKYNRLCDECREFNSGTGFEI